MQIYHTAHMVFPDCLADPFYIFPGGCNGLLDQYVLPRIRHCHRNIPMGKIRCHYGHRVHLRVCCQAVIVCIHLGDPIFVRDLPGPFLPAVADGHWAGADMLCINRRMRLSPGTGSHNSHSDLLHLHRFNLL